MKRLACSFGLSTVLLIGRGSTPTRYRQFLLVREATLAIIRAPINTFVIIQCLMLQQKH